MKRKWKYGIIHCTAHPKGRRMTGHEVAEQQMRPRSRGGRGWKRPGYGYVIRLDGTIDQLVPNDGNQYVEPREITNGVAGMNEESCSAAYLGGMSEDMTRPEDTRTPAQRNALAVLVKQWIAENPDILILGHNQVAAKACPSFDVPAWLRSIKVPEKNIYKG